MTTSSSPELRHHIYPDSFYGETPQLGGAAGDLARLIVKMGVDAGGPRDPQDGYSTGESLAGLPRLVAVRRAARTTGLRIGVRLSRPDRANSVRLEYAADKLGRVGLQIAYRPPHSSVRTLDMRWTSNDDATYRPHVPSFEGDEEPFGLEEYNRICATLWSRIMRTDSSEPLKVEYARCNVYRQPPMPGIQAVGAMA